MTSKIDVYCDPDLKLLLGQEADKEGVPLSEFAAKALAIYICRPDLAAIPRKKMGRPRKTGAASS